MEISKIAKAMAKQRPNFLVDGTIVDVTKWARPVGLTFPCFLDKSLWETRIKGASGEPPENQETRLTELLEAAARAAAQTRDVIADVNFFISGGLVSGEGLAYLVCGPFSSVDPSPTFTIVDAAEFPRE